MRLPKERFWRLKRQEDEEDEANDSGVESGDEESPGNGFGPGGRPGQEGGPPGQQSDGPPGPPGAAGPPGLQLVESAVAAVDLPAVDLTLEAPAAAITSVEATPQTTLVAEGTSVPAAVATPEAAIPEAPVPDAAVPDAVAAPAADTTLAAPTLEVEASVPVVLAPEEAAESSATPVSAPAATADAAAGLSSISAGTPGIIPGVLTTLVAPSISSETETEPASRTLALAAELDESPSPDATAGDNDDVFFVGTAGADIPDVTPNRDPFPDFSAGGDDDSATAGYTGLRDGEKGGIAVGSVAGFAFILTIILVAYKWRKGTLPRSMTPRFLSSISSRSTTPELKESLVDPNMHNPAWHYQDTSAKPGSIYRLQRSVTKLLRNPLAMNPPTSGGPAASRKSWASSIFRNRADSRASSRLGTRLFVRGRGAEEIPPLPPAYDRRGSNAWSVEEGTVRSAESVRAPTPSDIGGSIRDSVTFGARSYKSRYSFATVDTASTAPTAMTGSSGMSGEVSSVNELPLPPVPNVMSVWSSSSFTDGSDSDSASGQSSIRGSGPLSPTGTLGPGPGPGPGLLSPMPLPPEPAVHPLRAHSLRPVVTERKEEEGKGASWPL